MSDQKSPLAGNNMKNIFLAVIAVVASIFGITKMPAVFDEFTNTTTQKKETEQQQTQNQAESQDTREGQTVDFNTNTEEKEQEKKEKEINVEEVKKKVEIVTPKKPKKEIKVIPKSDSDDSDAGEQRLTYHGKDVVLTHHAKCRMDCRHISKKEVGEVLRNGKINKRKSNPNDPRCPTVALEKLTSDGQTVRIIVADCDRNAKLVTVIDLKNNYNCTCR